MFPSTLRVFYWPSQLLTEEFKQLKAFSGPEALEVNGAQRGDLSKSIAAETTPESAPLLPQHHWSLYPDTATLYILHL